MLKEYKQNRLTLNPKQDIVYTCYLQKAMWRWTQVVSCITSTCYGIAVLLLWINKLTDRKEQKWN